MDHRRYPVAIKVEKSKQHASGHGIGHIFDRELFVAPACRTCVAA